MARKKAAKESKGFTAWLAQRWNIDNTKELAKAIHELNNYVLSEVGIPNFELMNETDIVKLRLLASNLILSRPLHSTIDKSIYLAALRTLNEYTEYLAEKYGDLQIISSTSDSPTKVYKSTRRAESTQKTTQKTERKQVSPKETTSVPSVTTVAAPIDDILTLCYFLSRVNHDGYRSLGYSTFKQAFTGLGSLFGKTPAYIKAVRDEFDPYFDNGRKGFEKPLSPTREAIFNKFANISNEELTEVVLHIISSYSADAFMQNAQTSYPSEIIEVSNELISPKRKRIVITTEKAKNISARKKR